MPEATNEPPPKVSCDAPDDSTKENMMKIGKSLAAIKVSAEEASEDETSARSPKLLKKADKIQKLLARFESN